MTVSEVSSASPTADAVRPERLERSADGRRDVGLAARDRLKRGDLATWARARSVDALSMLAGQDAIRRVDLVPIRYGRMAASPWSFYRGAAAVMASDLASRPNTGLTVQLCGDAHLLNFGLWATPERQLSFDLRDFDETLPGPFEWDVSRLVASVVVLARENGLTESVADRAVADCLRAYRQRIARYARSTPLEIWYDLITADQLIALYKPAEQEQVASHIKQEGA